MQEFDLIVIGSGAGMNVAADGVARGKRVALVDRGPLGGTCLNRGCIPSKVMVHPATVIRTIEEAKAIGVHVTVDDVDFDRIMERTWKIVLDDRHEMEYGAAQSEALRFFNRDGAFVSDYTLQVGEEQITAPMIVIASGARPLIPPIQGLEAVGYLTSATVFDLQARPESLIIVGGGYIAAEFAHFFSAVGTEVTIVGRNPRLVPQEEPEISDLLSRRMATYAEIYTDHEAVQAEVDDGTGLKRVVATNRADGQSRSFAGQEILIAAGRRSNADLLKPENTGVETDEQGWIQVDDTLRTTKEGIWALGDALGRHQFRHTANYHAYLVSANAFSEHQHSIEEHAVPHAVFTYPEIGSAGLGQEAAQALYGDDLLVGMMAYSSTAKGYALGEGDGFFKVLVENGTGKILGAHAIGPQAALLVQQVVYVMNTQERNYLPLVWAQTIHPTLSEVVVGALGNVQPVGHHHHAHDHGRTAGK